MLSPSTPKNRLLALANGTDLRFGATPALEREMRTLVDEVERCSPVPDPARRPELLEGRWRLLYSSFRLRREPTLAALSFAALPDVTVRVDDVWQDVGAGDGRYDNVVRFSVGELRGLQRTRGRYRPAGDRRLAIEFYATDVVPEDRALPAHRFADALGAASERLAAPLETQGLWSDVVYLDAELRLMRGAQGSVYVLVRDGAATA